MNAPGDEYGGALYTATAFSEDFVWSVTTELLELLLSKGAHIKTRGEKYESALNAAIVEGFWDIVEVSSRTLSDPEPGMAICDPIPFRSITSQRLSLHMSP